MTTMLKKLGTQIVKQAGALSAVAALLAVAVLSVAMGCGGSAPGTATSNSSFAVDLSSSNGGSAGLVAITIRNASTSRQIGQVSFLKSAVTSTDILGNVTVITPAQTVTKVFDPAIPPGGAVAGTVIYNAPSGNFLGAVTTAVVASDTTGRFSQGFNLILEFGLTTVKITPADGTFSFQ